MGRSRQGRAGTAVLAAVVAGLVVVPVGTSAFADDSGTGVPVESSVAAAAQNAVDSGADAGSPTLPTGFADVEAIGDISEATSVAFAANGTAFVALKTGVIKSF